MSIKYNTGGTTGSLGGANVDGRASGQLSNDFFYQKKALIELVKEQYFSQLANVTAMPKNMGKKIKQYLYLPMLDDRNINDQGIDAAGAAITMTSDAFINFPTQLVIADASAAALVTAINGNIDSATRTAVTTYCTNGGNGSAGGALTLVTLTKNSIKFTDAAATSLLSTYATIGAVKQAASGNLWGSSKDIGSISGKLPALSETGGRVNKVGFKRKELEGTIAKFGFFDEYTQESMDFDSDADLWMHINREMLRGANEITEDALQVDLINSAGTVMTAGGSTTLRGITTSATASLNGVVTYAGLMRLSIALDNNRTPKKTTVISGSRMVDTKTLPACRVLFMGSEMLPTFKEMKDLHNNPAFISVEKYSDGGNTVTGEVGAVDQWRLVVVPEMTKWAGGGALVAGAALTPAEYYQTAGRFDVFPLLAVGDESFTTIGFQTDGKSVKFTIMHKKPGMETADKTDPYGESGFMSIKWYYGFMALRPERIALFRTLAKL